MAEQHKIGLVVPFAADTVPFEGPLMYPDVRFIPRGVGVRALTPEGYEPAWNAILPAAAYLAGQDVDAIMIIGTSLTFYRGPQLLEARHGIPVVSSATAAFWAAILQGRAEGRLRLPRFLHIEEA